MEKSFSFLVKEEILNVERVEQDNALLIDAIIIANGYFINENLHIKILEKDLRRSLANKIEKVHGIKTTIKRRDIVITDKKFVESATIEFSEAALEIVEEYRVFLTGLFFGKGYVNRPDSKYYHMDFRVKDLIDSFTIRELLQALDVEAKHHFKNGWHYVYIKKHFDISEILKMFGTVDAAQAFDTIKIEKDFMSALEQTTALEVANQKKTAEASLRQCTACFKVIENFRKYNLNGKHRIIAELRVKHPEMSLTDLAYEYTLEVIDENAFDPMVSRQTVSRWLQQICKEAERKQDEN